MGRTARASGLAIAVVVASVLAAGCGNGGPAWWGLAEPVGPSSTVVPILVRVGSSSCNRFEGVTTTESDTTVVIRAHVSSIGDRDCTSDLQGRRVEVLLTRPLGDRDLEGCAHTDRRPCDQVIASLL